MKIRICYLNLIGLQTILRKLLTKCIYYIFWKKFQRKDLQNMGQIFINQLLKMEIIHMLGKNIAASKNIFISKVITKQILVSGKMLPQMELAT